MASFQGTTTDTFDNVFTYTNNADGVRFWGGIKNTGVNGMNVRATVLDVWGDAETASIVVDPGEKLSFDTVVSSYASAQPPFANILVEVQSALAGQPTTFDLRTLLF
jgi:hypothetical protein